MTILNMVLPEAQQGWQPGANTLCYYTFDNTLADASGNHTDASNMSSCTFIEAYTGSIKKVLDKPNGSYISLPATFLQTAVSTYTMLFWFKSTQTSQAWLMGCNGSNNIGGYPGNVLGGIDDNAYKKFGFLYGRDYPYRRIARNASTYRDGNWHLMSIRRGTGDVIVGIDKNYTTTYELNTPSDYSIGGSGIRRGIGTRSTDSGGGINTTSVFQLGDFITENKYRTDQELSDYYNQTKGNYGLYYYNTTITGSTVVANFTPSQGSDIQGCYISPDGTRMYIDFWSNKRLYQYDLSTPRNVSTATAVRYIGVTTPDGIYFDNSGTYMFIGCENDKTIKRYTLSTPWDISTASQDQSLSTGSNYFVYNVCLSEDGKYIYAGSYSGSQDEIWQYELTTPFDLTTATNRKSVAMGGLVLCLNVKNYGKYLYLSHVSDLSNIKQYELATPYDITSTKTEVGSYSISGSNDARALFVSNDCKYWTIATGSSGTAIRQLQTVQL